MFASIELTQKRNTFCWYQTLWVVTLGAVYVWWDISPGWDVSSEWDAFHPEFTWEKYFT